MYGTYGNFRRLGLTTSSHREPKMTQNEWMAAYGTQSNTGEKPPRRAAAVNTQSASRELADRASTVRAMVEAAQIQRAESLTRRPSRASPDVNDENSDSADYSSDDESRSISLIESSARADRRLLALRKKHRHQQEKSKRATKRREIKEEKKPSKKRKIDEVKIDEEESGEEIENSTNKAKSARITPVATTNDPRERIRASIKASLIQSYKLTSNNKENLANVDESENSGDHDENDDDDKFGPLSIEIEWELYDYHSSNISARYRQHSRDLAFSLAQNSKIVESLLNNSLTPVTLVAMPITDLAPDSLIAQRAREKQEISNEQIMKNNEGVKSTEYLCPSCKNPNRDCVFYTIREGRDKTSKSEIWGNNSNANDETVILVRCTNCSYSWTRNE